MATPAQTLANQKNAQLSTGPRSPEGKRQSSLNSLKHGLTGQAVVLSTEDAEAYAAFTARLTQDFAPQGSAEELHVQTICDCRWRIERAQNMETSLTFLARYEELPHHLAGIEDATVREALILAHGYSKRERQIHNLQLHTARLQRTLLNAMDDLRILQLERRATEQAQLAQAVDARIAHREAGRPFNPAQFGFVLTDEQLDREELRRSLKQSARRQQFAGM